jgi:hypothetical protein
MPDTGVRDEAERVIRAWDAHETARGARPVVDYDCAPPPPGSPVIAPASSRLAVLTRLTGLRDRAGAAGDTTVATALDAHVAYLGHVLGERPPLESYVERTQGIRPVPWPDDYTESVETRARQAIHDAGLQWGPRTMSDLAELDGVIDLQTARDRVVDVAAQAEPAVRALAGTDAAYEVRIEVVEVDDYWAYWLDGAGSRVRLRFNLRHARFTESRLRQFALHELLGHALQSASYARRAADGDVPWIRLLSTNLPYQVCLEGLATALPLFVAPDDELLRTRVRIDHHVHLVRAALHLAVNHGEPLAGIAARTRRGIPWWDDSRISDELADRGTDPMLRSYLWSYAAGTDWFVNLADRADTATRERVLRAAYDTPLTPTDLRALWPATP